MNFFRWLMGKFRSEAVAEGGESAGEGQSVEVYVRELAIGACCKLVAGALCRCEFKTYIDGTPTKGREYFLWNYSPNANQSAGEFYHKLVYKLYRNGEALVIENAGQLLIADSFSRTEYALYDDVFSSVTVGDFTFGRTFLQSEVLYFRLGEGNMRPIINGLYDAYREMLDYTMKSYRKSRGSKGVLEVDAAAAGTTDFSKKYDELKNRQYKEFVEKESAVLPLFRGLKYTDLGSKTYSTEGTRDIRAMIDDVTDFTARAFGIPPSLVNGSVQDVSSAIDQLLTFTIDPLADVLEAEINRKRCGFDGVSRGTYVKIDTHGIRHTSILTSASSIDKLVSSGVCCINDIRALWDEPPIDEEWAWGHFMTKNYASVHEMKQKETKE